VETRFRYIKDGFEGILYKAQREDDRLLIVVQGLKGLDLPCRYAELFCVREHNIRLLYFFDEWDLKGTEENEIPVDRINGDILLLTSTHDESVPAKRDAELLVKRLQRSGFKHGFKHIDSKTGSHNLGYFPVNNNMLPREKKYPEECQSAREETLELILNTLDKWSV